MAIYDRQKAEVAIPQIEKRIAELENNFVDRCFPIGSYFYTSEEKYDPAVIGGEWELVNSSDPYKWKRIR